MRWMKRIVCLLWGIGALAHAGEFENLLERANAGDPGAQLEVAAKYAAGDGVAKDAKESVKWVEAAAAQGIAEAQLKLGAMYLAGRGVPRDALSAAKWYKLAAEKGEAAAQVQLARMFLTGSGGMTDPAEAWMWAKLASKKGDHAARRVLASIQPKMNAVTLADAQARVAEFEVRTGAAAPPPGVPEEAPPMPQVEPIPDPVPEDQD